MFKKRTLVNYLTISTITHLVIFSLIPCSKLKSVCKPTETDKKEIIEVTFTTTALKTSIKEINISNKAKQKKAEVKKFPPKVSKTITRSDKDLKLKVDKQQNTNQEPDLFPVTLIYEQKEGAPTTSPSFTGELLTDLGNGKIGNEKNSNYEGIERSTNSNPQADIILGNSDNETDIISAYTTLLQRRIETNKKYPLAAQRQGQAGEIKVKFTLDKNGILDGDIEIVSSCKWNRLNKAAQLAIRKSFPFPMLPIQLKKERLSFTISIIFRLL
ncbi:MAG: TonB family protein [bacterium]